MGGALFFCPEREGGGGGVKALWPCVAFVSWEIIL